MTLKEFKMILDRLGFQPKSVILSGTGEPLMNPEFIDMVDALAERNIECEFFTNGTLLSENNREKILARPNISYIAVSCDGAEKETFETLRYGANFEKWKIQTGEFLCEVNKSKAPRMLVSTNTVLGKSNFSQIDGIIRLASELGFHRMHFLDMIPIDKEAQNYIMTDEDVRSIDQEAFCSLGESLGLQVMFHLRELPRKNRIRCLQPWEYIMIRPGGECSAVLRGIRF